MSNYSHSLIKRLNGINIQVEFLLLCIDLSFGKYKNFFLNFLKVTNFSVVSFKKKDIFLQKKYLHYYIIYLFYIKKIIL